MAWQLQFSSWRPTCSSSSKQQVEGTRSPQLWTTMHGHVRLWGYHRCLPLLSLSIFGRACGRHSSPKATRTEFSGVSRQAGSTQPGRRTSFSSSADGRYQACGSYGALAPPSSTSSTCGWHSRTGYGQPTGWKSGGCSTHRDVCYAAKRQRQLSI
jgi:hypothetical protein